MDGNLDEDEAIELNKHISQCYACRQDFILYNSILDEFSNIENIISAPIGFEIQVMERINQLPDLYKPLSQKNENILCKLWGSISVVAGIGAIITMNKEPLEHFIINNPYIYGYAKMFYPVQKYVVNLSISINTFISSAVNVLNGYVSDLRYVSFIIFILLIAAQYFIYKKDKVEVQ